MGEGARMRDTIQEMNRAIRTSGKLPETMMIPFECSGRWLRLPEQALEMTDEEKAELERKVKP